MKFVLLCGIVAKSHQIPSMPYRKIRTRIPLPPPRVLAGGAFAFVALVTAWVWPAPPEPERQPSTGIALTATSARIAAPAAARPARMVYRNSVLPGGVGSSAELRSALAHDPVAAAHYAGFNVDAARNVQVERSRMAHVSYRIGDKIYWTKKPVRLAQGETLLTDGEHLVRARCGNRIADEAQAPVLLNEPAPEVLEMAFVSAEPLIDAPSEGAPNANLAATAQAADAQLATRTRGAPSFALALDSGMQSPPAFYTPTRILAFNATPPAGAGGSSVPVRATPPAGGGNSVPVRTPSPAPDSPPPKSPPEKSPPPGSSPPQSPTPPSSPPTTPEPSSSPRPNGPQAPTPIPEPGSAALLGLGFALLLLIRATGKRRRTSTPAAGSGQGFANSAKPCKNF